MQNTRLNTLVAVTTEQFGRALRNPWRRLSLLGLSLLFGTFLGPAVSSLAGQRAYWDISSAAILTVIIELISRIIYGNRQLAQSLPAEALNALKIGVTYSLFLEAFKLNS
ncbi:MAG: DUF565 domain-containing protein [Oscillatoria princeps RMCB-10]|jgi:hypothetical protein|nr:DUF565 domain-containing protein [Oscillatoria princeps RMCB-10]